jgi:hypothetical protein
MTVDDWDTARGVRRNEHVTHTLLVVMPPRPGARIGQRAAYEQSSVCQMEQQSHSLTHRHPSTKGDSGLVTPSRRIVARVGWITVIKKGYCHLDRRGGTLERRPTEAVSTSCTLPGLAKSDVLTDPLESCLPNRTALWLSASSSIRTG